MHGDRRPFPVMLITLDPESMQKWAADHGLAGQPMAKLVAQVKKAAASELVAAIRAV